MRISEWMSAVCCSEFDTDRLLAGFEKVKQMSPLLPPNPQRLIQVGRVVKWKRVYLLLESVKLLEADYPGIQLLVVGYGPEEDQLKQQTESLGLGEIGRAHV